MTLYMNIPQKLTPLKSHPISVLLVDDQLIVAEAIRRMLADNDDISFHYCQEPEKAFDMAAQVKPTVILQDLIMPGIDGMMLLRYFRANPVTRDVPLIVLSANEDSKTKAEAFGLGANDYLVKLPDKIELLARIRYHSNAYIRLLQRNEAYEKLRESQHILYEQLTEAAVYVRSLLPPKLDGEIQASWEFIPSTQLGGDAFSYQWLDGDHFAIYLLDVCGHGVGAALLSISVMNVLRSRTLTNADFHDPADVLSSLNDVFPMEKNNNMFFTIWYGVYSKKKKQLIYSTGGHPPAILISGDSLISLKTPGLVIGGMANTKYKNATQNIRSGDKLYVFSDGVYEMVDLGGNLLKLEDFIKTITRFSKEPGDGDIQGIINFSQEINGSIPFPDDYSIVRLIF